MVARVTGEGLMVDQNEVAVVWVTREAQAKADRRPWTVAGTVARVTRRLCLPSVDPSQSPPPPPHPIPPRAQLQRGSGSLAEEKSSKVGIIFIGQSPLRLVFPSLSQSIGEPVSSDLGT